jgi:hypothetical protein
MPGKKTTVTAVVANRAAAMSFWFMVVYSSN